MTNRRGEAPPAVRSVASPTPEDAVAATIESRDPWSQEQVYAADAATSAQVASAVERASLAQPDWSDRPVAERAELLNGVADEVTRAAADLTALIVAEVGKLHEEAAAEVAWMATSARWYAQHPPTETPEGKAQVRRAPLGVVAAITPWNVPLVTPAWKWLPALIAGNTVVWKPSERATGTATAAHELASRAGVPDDVLALVPGDATTATTLCADVGVDGVHFTGSTAAGRAISRQVADRFVRCSLEMSGINLAVVFADADVEAAAAAIVASATAINGQKCSAVRQVLVERKVEAALVEAIADRVRELEPGDPADPATRLGPLIHPAAAESARTAVDRSLSQGARLVTRSPEISDVASAFPATVLLHLSAADPLRTSELFAPVLAVESFDDRDTVWDRANDTPFGLTAAVHTMNPDLMDTAVKRLRTGVVAFNRRSDDVALEAPFAGRKASGNGPPEGGTYVYEGLTAWQAVYGR